MISLIECEFGENGRLSKLCPENILHRESSPGWISIRQAEGKMSVVTWIKG